MSRRQELLEFAETGRLRQVVHGHMSADATDLLVDITLRYCGPRRRLRSRKAGRE